jgi:hypothetical protein
VAKFQHTPGVVKARLRLMTRAIQTTKASLASHRLIARAEGSKMRLQRLALGLTIVNLVLLALLATGAVQPSMVIASQTKHPQAQVLRGRALEIVDEKGTIRSRINVEQDGEVIFRMADRSGAIRVKLGGGDGGSGLMLADEASEPGIHMIARRTGTRARPTTTSLTVRVGRQERVIKP